MAVKKNKNLTYCEARLKELGITDETNSLKIIYGDSSPGQFRFFSQGKDDNIQINYLDLNGNVVLYDCNGKLKQFTRIRIKNPVNGSKYLQPFKSGVYPFITPRIIEKFKRRTEIETLFIVEGEFKAFSGFLFGLDIIGIGGIQNFRDKAKNELDNSIKSLIEACKVKNIVLLFDADCLSINFKPERDLYNRPNSFYTAVKDFKEFTKPLNVDVYFSHILSDFEDKSKGLDDLIIHPETDKKILLKELASFTVGRKRKYIHCQNITENSIFHLRKYFGIDSPTSFYTKYANILQESEFIYNKSKYRHDGEKLKVSWYGEATQYVRVATHYYKRVTYKNSHGGYEEMLKEWSIAEINRDYNNNKDFVKQIPKYDMFCNIPNNTGDYQRVHVEEQNGMITKLYNRYHPLKHELRKGRFEATESFLKHISNSENLKGETLYPFLLDYLQILYTNPLQRLPVLCLVSKERNTGKSTFLDFMRLIFCENVAILDNERFTGKFTSHFIDKLVIGVDESFIPVEQKLMKERIKNFATGKKQWLEAKGQPAQELDYFGKLVLCSNDESNFMQIDEGENRFAVLKVNILEKDDPNILRKMEKEIPAFLRYLNERKLNYEIDKSRFSFAPEVYLTQAAKKVIDRTRTPLEAEIKDFIREQFLIHKQRSLDFAPVDIAEIINENNSFKYSKAKIKEYLYYELNMRPSERLKKYTLYTHRFDLNIDKVVTEVKQYKAGTPYTFYYKDWLSENEIIELEKDLKNELSPNI